jgi:type I restriction-modification system DNA methylase subunit
MMIDIKKFITIFERIARSKSEDTVFSDFLDIVICALSAGKYEEEYLSIVKRYQKEEVNLFCELLAEMVIIMDNNGAGLNDCLGEFFQGNISRGKNGQFFTPSHVTDFMSEIVMDKGTTVRKTIMDPCCGSGRMLLSAAKVNRNNYFFGADIDSRCIKMCAINLCLNGLPGEVAHMNSLSLEHWGGYSIGYLDSFTRIPVITKLPANEGIIINTAPFNRTDTENRERPTIQQGNVITITQTKLNLE